MSEGEETPLASSTSPRASAESPIPPVRGTRDWLPGEFGQLRSIESLLIDRFSRAGYDLLRTPVLEFTALHERKSGAGIVSKLYELADGRLDRLCLRPELTASIVRAFVEAEPAPPLPWRVSSSGPVFRHEPDPNEERLREFQQVGVELLGAPGPHADAEVIGLADSSLRELGIPDATLRIGHVGLIMEGLERSGLPPAARAALVEMLSEAAAEGRNVRALESAVEQLAGWLGAEESEDLATDVDSAPERGVDRLFRHLVPDVAGRRTGREILARLHRKWDLGRSLHVVLDQVRRQVHELSELQGPALEVLDRLERNFQALAPASIAELRSLVGLLAHHGSEPERIVLDLGFGRGIGFYSQMIFELIASAPNGPVVVCGGGRYDGLTRVLGSDRDDRGVGFAFGLERLQQALGARQSQQPAPRRRGYLVVGREATRLFPSTIAEAIRLAQLIRREGGRAVLHAEEENGEDAIEVASRLGLRKVVVVGTSGEPELYDSESDTHGLRNVTDEDLIRYARADAASG